MSKKDPITKKIEAELPNEVNGYQRRVLVLGFVNIEYSKKPIFRHAPKSTSQEDIDNYLLVDVKGKNVNDAIKKMKEELKKYT